MARSRGAFFLGIPLRRKNRSRKRVRPRSIAASHETFAAIQTSQGRQEQTQEPGAGSKGKEVKTSAGGNYFCLIRSRNASHKIGAVSGPTLFTSPYCAFLRP